MFKIVLISLFLVLNLYSNEVYILPKQGEEIKDKISESITSAKSEILIAMYNFSYKKFAKDLVDASKKGVKITVFLDAKKVKEDSEIFDYLKKNDIKVVLMKDKMHLKLIRLFYLLSLRLVLEEYKLHLNINLKLKKVKLKRF